MEATDIEHGNLVSATAWRFFHLRQHKTEPHTTICSHSPATGAFPKSVTSTKIISLIRLHAAKLGFQHLGFYPHDTVFHFLQSGGYTTLHQSPTPDSTIKIIGQWCSDSCLIYLQGQVATFTKGVATAMAKMAWFHHQAASPCTPA